MEKDIDKSIIDDLMAEKESLRFDDWLRDYTAKYPNRDQELVLKPVEQIMSNIKEGSRSFVVYGEPQSGKTEMMIALSCRLFDEGVNTIFVLMHDIKTLQKQNFQDRFVQNENFGVTPILAEEFFKTEEKIRKNQNWLIFGRKNSSQLERLISETRMLKRRVILDDEADYATPDSNIGKRRKEDPTKINQHMKKLVGDNGYYIGVTATPGRLDLNNTLYNEADKWVFCEPGEGYTGVNYFFPENPTEIQKNYTLTTINPNVEYKTDLEKAIFRFMARNAYMNLRVNEKRKNYSMVIHTHYKIVFHEEDRKTVQNLVSTLQSNEMNKKRKIFEKILKETKKIYKDEGLLREVMAFIRDKSKSSTALFTLNSRNDINDNIRALKAPAQFTFVFGGNTLSRGVTFENMLSFYFSRSVKRALQQNTYVQIARHFGYRKDTGLQFELTVPEDIWEKWYTCFSTHEMSLDYAQSGNPLWIKHKFTHPADSASIDKNNVVAGHDGTLSFAKFKVTKEIEGLFCDPSIDPISKLKQFNSLTNDECFPKREIERIENSVTNAFNEVDIITAKGSNTGNLRDITNQTSLGEEEHKEITRNRGLAPGTEEKNIENAYCYLVPYKNSKTGEGRIVYSKNKTISYLKNMRRNLNRL